MKIKTITSQHRRDFSAIFKCEHCGNEDTHNGCYDDDNFHENVIPTIKCSKCDKTSPKDYKPEATKYPEGMQL